MDLKLWTEELRQLVNVDCGTATISGVAQVAETLAALWKKEGWHCENVDLGAAVGPGLLVTNKLQSEHYDVLLIGPDDVACAFHVFPSRSRWRSRPIAPRRMLESKC